MTNNLNSKFEKILMNIKKFIDISDLSKEDFDEIFEYIFYLRSSEDSALKNKSIGMIFEVFD